MDNFQTLVPELANYAGELSAAGFAVYLPVKNDRAPLTWFHYSRTVDGRECYGTVQTERFEGVSHAMPITPSRLNGSGAIIGGQWGDDATLNLDNLDPLSVAYAEAVARPSNWCPFNAEPTQEAVQRAQSGVSVPKKYYQGARLDNAEPWGIGTHYVASDVA